MNALLRSTALILCAFAAGWGVRAWRLHRAPQRAAAATVHAVPAPPHVATSPAPAGAVAKEDSVASQNPLRSSMAGVLGMIAGLKTAEDCERLFAELLRAPMDKISLEQLPVPVWEILFKRWASLDPAAALRATTTVPQRQLSSSLMSTVFSEWLRRDRVAVMAALDDLPDGWPGHMGRHLVFSELSTTDPAAAIALAQSLPPGEARQSSLRTALGSWAGKDPQAALAWILAQPDKAARQEPLHGVLQGGVMSHTHPDMVWQTLQEHVSDPAQRRALQKQFVMTAGQGDPAGTLARIAALPAADRPDLLRMLGEWSGGARRDPARSADLEKRVPAAGPERDAWNAGRARGYLIDSQHIDAPAAIALIGQLPEGEQRASLYKEAGETWARHDAVAASHYLNAQPPGPERDAFLGEFVRAHFPNDPEAALIWSTAITDAGKRDRRLNRLLPQWHQRDPAAAEAWITATDRLTDGERAALLDKVRPAP